MDNSEYIKEAAKRITDLHADILFNDELSPVDNHPFAANSVTMAMAYLELAAASMRLAGLHVTKLVP